MAILVAAERGLGHPRGRGSTASPRMLDLLTAATCYHGAYAHFVNGRTAATIPFYRKDDGGDSSWRTSFLCMGLLCARQYFNGDAKAEQSLRGRITWLWEEGRMGLVHPGRPPGAVLALESQQRLGDGSRDPRLE